MNRRSALEWSPGAAGGLLALVPADLDDTPDLNWRDLALCAQVDPEIFFPEQGGSVRLPKRICQGCEVRAECLEYALENDEKFGVWGGLSEPERSRLRPAGPPARPPRRPDYCGNDRHVKGEANTGPDGRCLDCRRERETRVRAEPQRKDLAA